MPGLSAQEKPSLAIPELKSRVLLRTSFRLTELAESFPAYRITCPLSRFIFRISPTSDQNHKNPISRRLRAQSHSVIHFSSPLPGSRVTWNETGVLCQILLKVGPSRHAHWPRGVRLSRCWGREQRSQVYLTVLMHFLFPFIPLNHASKLFHSFYLERSPSYEKN